MNRVWTTAADAPKPASTSTSCWPGILLVAGAIIFLWFAPASYQIYLALHVVAIVVWVGGDITLTTLGIVFERKGDGEALAQLGKMGAWVGNARLHADAVRRVRPRSRAGREGPLGLGHVLGRLRDRRLGDRRRSSASAFVGPELGRIDKAAAEHGPTSPEVGRRVKRLFTIFRFDTALLVLIVIDMTAKPTF